MLFEFNFNFTSRLERSYNREYVIIENALRKIFNF